MKPGAVDLRIDELVLRGFEQLDTTALAEALEVHLTRLLQVAPPELPARDITLLNAPAIEVTPGVGPEEIACSLAQSLHALLAGESTASGGRS